MPKGHGGSRWSRVARGWAAAGFATIAAAVSHTIAGEPPSSFGMLASIILAGAVCTFLVGRALSAWRLAVAIGVSQALFHGIFASVGTSTAAAAPHVHGALYLPDVGASTASLAMWCAHIVAAAVTFLAFHRGERAFIGLRATARLFISRLVTFVAAVPIRVPRHTIAVVTPIPPRRRTALLSVLRHRGPPKGALAG